MPFSAHKTVEVMTDDETGEAVPLGALPPEAVDTDGGFSVGRVDARQLPAGADV